MADVNTRDAVEFSSIYYTLNTNDYLDTNIDMAYTAPTIAKWTTLLTTNSNTGVVWTKLAGVRMVPTPYSEANIQNQEEMGASTAQQYTAQRTLKVINIPVTFIPSSHKSLLDLSPTRIRAFRFTWSNDPTVTDAGAAAQKFNTAFFIGRLVVSMPNDADPNSAWSGTITIAQSREPTGLLTLTA